MDSRRLKASDICDALHVSEQTIHQWRSMGVPPRRKPHVMRFMAEWLEANEKPTDGEDGLQTLVLTPTIDEFEQWNEAALEEGLTIKKWVVASIERGLDAARGRDSSKNPRLKNILEGPEPTEGGEDDIFRIAPSGRKIPYAGRVSVGVTIDEVEEQAGPLALCIRRNQPYPDDYYAVRAEGTFMEPLIPHGSYVILREFSVGTIPKRTTVVAFNDGKKITLKELFYRKAKKGEAGATGAGEIPMVRFFNSDAPDIQKLSEGRIEAIFVEVVNSEDVYIGPIIADSISSH
jgi:SOS-response transcriptional repressor LexA